MLFTPDFANDCYRLPPLDIFVALQADDRVHGLARQLDAGCHHVTLAPELSKAFAQIDAQAPDVVLVDASTAEGMALACRVRASFAEKIVLVALRDAAMPPAHAALFDCVLPKPLDGVRFAQALGLVPEPASEDIPEFAFIPRSGLKAEGALRGWRQAA